ncbi:MAG: phosphatase PAP2 family protein [Opitutaceae bacterium]|nr:phosphatase PAP2 family protein [Opitutaceae bacterium]
MNGDAARKTSLPPPRRPVLLLVLGVALAAGMAWAFGWIASESMAGRLVSTADEAVAAWFRVQETPGLTAVMQLVTGLGSMAWVTGITLIAALGLVWKRRWYGLLALGLAVPGGMALNVFLKTLFHRPRPVPELWAQIFSGYGFPSGHTMAATLLYGALAVLACGAINRGRGRMGACVGAGALVGLVGWSRLQLGAHFLSDVIGAVAAGLAWLGLCFAAADILRRCRVRPPLPPSPR